MHYDLEVSGFPSSHAGHIILLSLKEQDYPGTKKIEDWPTWDLPIFHWAKSQGAVVGFAHSGWGLQVSGKELPTYQMPPFDGIGANEYIVDVTHPDAVDFISAVDTPYVWELNIWYHTLNVGFRTRITGETDFPCIYDGKVGLGRTYAKLDDALTYEGWLRGLQAGRSYVSDGKTHLMDFKVNGTGAGAGATAGEVRLNAAGNVTVTAHRGRLPSGKAQRSHPQPPLRSEALLGRGAGPHRRHARRARGNRRQRQSRRPSDHRGRRQTARAEVRRSAEGKQLDRRAGAAFRAHQPGVRPGGRQADPRVAGQRGVVPERRESVLDPEGASHAAERTGRGEAGIRSRARGLPRLDQRERRGISFLFCS